MDIEDLTNIKIKRESFEILYSIGEAKGQMQYQTVELPMPLLESWVLSFANNIPTRESFVVWKREQANSDPHANRQQGTKPNNNSIDISGTSLHRD